MNAQFVFSRNRVPLVVLTVSRQPGNNFRVAASCETNSLARLTVTNNVPDTIYVPGSDAAVSGFNGQITPLLTVWRRLHVELDSMAAVGTNNTITGCVIRINGTTNQPTQAVFVDRKLHDGSPHLNSTPKGNGRFENGRITIGTGGGATTTTNLLGNGVIGAGNYVSPKSGQRIEIPFNITKGANSTNGYIVTMSPGPMWSLFGTSVTFSGGTYNNGTLTVAGHVFNVQNTSGSQVKVNGADITLNFSGLHDDDDDTLLPLDLVNSGFTNRLLLAFAPTYLQPIVDGGGNAAHNRLGVPFVRNLPRRLMISDVENFIQVTDGIQSDTHRADDFWVVYGLVAFQSTTSTNKTLSFSAHADADPDGETALGGVNSAFGGIGAVVFIEDCVEFIRQGICGVPDNVDFTTFVEGAMLHELGHQFNLGHPATGVMGCDFWQANAGFVPSDLACIRGQPKSPGRRTEGVTPKTPFGVPCN